MTCSLSRVSEKTAPETRVTEGPPHHQESSRTGVEASPRAIAEAAEELLSLMNWLAGTPEAKLIASMQ